MVGNRVKRIAVSLVAVGTLGAPAAVLAHGNGYQNGNQRSAAVECAAGERVATERRRVNGRTRVVARCEEDERTKTKTKTALMIAGGAATGAGVGAAVDGKKGALIGATIGGGAASIYEAAKRR